MKARYNDTVLNSIDFENVVLKYLIKKGNLQEITGLEERLVEIASQMTEYLDREQTMQISKDILKERQTKIENSYTKDLQILRDIIRNIDFELSKMITHFDSDSQDLLGRYAQLEFDLRGANGLYLKCKSLFN